VGNKYFVATNIILKWVNYLQELKKQKITERFNGYKLLTDLRHGEGEASYHCEDLNH